MQNEEMIEKTNFKEKLREHTPDILFIAMMIVVFSVFANARKHGLLQNNNQITPILLNDTINQKVR